MLATKGLGDLLEQVYALAEAPSAGWTGALESLARYSGAVHGGLFELLLPIKIVRYTMSGVAPEDIRAAVEEHGETDPWGGRLYGNLGRAECDHEVEPPGFDDQPLVRDHFDRMDMRRYVRVVQGSSAGGMVFLGAFRPRRAGPLDPREVARFGQAARHVLRVHALRDSLARTAALGASLEAGLVASARAIVLVDGGGRVLFANPAAEALVRRGVLAHRGARLSVGDGTVASRFAAALAAVCSGGAGVPEDGAVIVLADLDPTAPSGLARHAAHLHALPSSHPFRAVAPRAAACVQLVALNDEDGAAPALDPEVLVGAFDLTPREARLAAFVGAGHSIAAAGQAFGVSRHTLRTQLRAVFEKTSTHRQPELVRLVQGLASLKA